MDNKSNPFSKSLSSTLTSLKQFSSGKTVRMRFRLINSRMAPTGSGDRSIRSTSHPTRSLDTFPARASRTRLSVAASTKASSIVKRSLAAKRTDRRARRGSSRRVVNGAKGVATIPLLRSSNPLPVQSSSFPRTSRSSSTTMTPTATSSSSQVSC